MSISHYGNFYSNSCLIQIRRILSAGRQKKANSNSISQKKLLDYGDFEKTKQIWITTNYLAPCDIIMIR